MSIKLLGIKNCDTVRKARKWLEANAIDYIFQDIRAEPLTKKEWSTIVKNTDTDKLVNTRGTTWRKLSDTDKDTSSQTKIVNLLAEHPTVMKRPLLIKSKTYHVGFKTDEYVDLLGGH